MRGIVVLSLLICLLPILARADGACKSGYTMAATTGTGSINYTSFIQTFQDGCPNGYQKYSAEYPVVYAAPRDSYQCPTGQYYKSGSCVAYDAGGCDTGFYNETPAVTTTTFEQTYQNGCLSGFQVLSNRRDVMYPVVSFTPKCGNGYYPTKTGCVAYTADDCPTNYVASVPSNAFARYNANGECDTNYSLYDTDTATCAQYVGTNTADLCTPLCEYGYNHTHADTCARPCTSLTRLRSTTGLNLPLYLDKTTSTALGFRRSAEDDACYINMLPGNLTGTINVRDNRGDTYHGVE